MLPMRCRSQIKEVLIRDSHMVGSGRRGFKGPMLVSLRVQL